MLVFWLAVAAFGVAAVLLTLARLVDPEGSTAGIAAVAFTPWALPLYAAGLVLAQIDHVLVGIRLAALGQHTARVPDTDHLVLVARVAPR